jgi:hypothetical protein
LNDTHSQTPAFLERKRHFSLLVIPLNPLWLVTILESQLLSNRLWDRVDD